MPIQTNILIWDMVLNLILFDVFSYSGFDWDKKFIIFGVNNRSSMQIDKEKIYINSLWRSNIDYNIIFNSNVIDIHKHLIKKSRYKIMFVFIKFFIQNVYHETISNVWLNLLLLIYILMNVVKLTLLSSFI